MKIVSCFMLMFIAANIIQLAQSASKCYLCDHCPDPFSTNARGVDLEDCGSDNYECITVTKRGATFSSISRSCKKAGTCVSGVTSEDDITVTTSCCQNDLCNHSSGFKSTSITVITALFVTLISIFVVKS